MYETVATNPMMQRKLANSLTSLTIGWSLLCTSLIGGSAVTLAFFDYSFVSFVLLFFFIVVSAILMVFVLIVVPFFSWMTVVVVVLPCDSFF